MRSQLRTLRLLRLVGCSSSGSVRCTVLASQPSTSTRYAATATATASSGVTSWPAITLEVRRKKLAWEGDITERLSNEFAHRVEGFSLQAKRKSLQSEIVRHVLSEDYVALMSSVLGFVDKSELGAQKRFRGDDELFSLVIVLAARAIDRYASGPNVDDIKGTSLFYSIVMMLEKLPALGRESTTASLLLLDRLQNWTDQRAMDERSEDIDRTFSNTQKAIAEKIHGVTLSINRLIFDEEEEKIIVERLRNLSGAEVSLKHEKVPNNWKYKRDLGLVKELRDPVSEAEYLGSPFSVPFAADKMSELFEEELRLESEHFLHVPNFSCSSAVSAEDLLSEWKWEAAISETLKKRIEKLRHYFLKDLLSCLDLSECVSLMMCGVRAACTMGKFVPATTFERLLVAPILDTITAKFMRAVAPNRRKILGRVFSRYAKYFTEDYLPREHNHREWWLECCREAGVDPHFDVNFAFVSKDVKDRMGSFLSDVVFEACTFPRKTQRKTSHARASERGMTPAFSLSDVAVLEESALIEDEKANLVKMVQLHNDLLEIFDEHQFRDLTFASDFLPMKVPPRPWLDRGYGGPLYTKQSKVLRDLPEIKMVRTTEEMQRRITDRRQGRPVFDALNDLGATPWKLNHKVLDVIVEIFQMTNDASQESFLEKLAIPLRGDTVAVPSYAQRFGADTKVAEIPRDQWRQFSKDMYAAVKKKNELNSLWHWLLYRVSMAKYHKDDVLFFPHNMDFRGRVYPISPYLQHMGDDLNRCILQFARGKPLGENGFRWLKLHCINLTGHMKRQSVGERLTFADENIPKFLDSANNPLTGERWWVDSDEPWQTLAACVEIRDAIASGDPTTFVSHLPIHQDGSCNGLQHYAALGRDLQGGSEVNLTPSDKPADVYSSVALRVEGERLKDEQSSNDEVRNLVRQLRVALPSPVPRKVIKQTVMTTVYGVTMYGACLQIKRQLKALNVDAEMAPKFAAYLAQKTFKSLSDAFTSSMALKNWFRKCANAIVSLMRTVEWVTPLGLPVMQPYLKLEKKRGRFCLLPMKTKQINAFPPNFVHSLDSTHMMLTALHCRRVGLTFAAVHDCFWTHASTVPIMNTICREQFIRLHKEPIVEHCSEFFINKYLNEKEIKAMDPEEVKRLRKIFELTFKWGELDIERVRDSVYFFS